MHNVYFNVYIAKRSRTRGYKKYAHQNCYDKYFLKI